MDDSVRVIVNLTDKLNLTKVDAEYFDLPLIFNGYDAVLETTTVDDSGNMIVGRDVPEYILEKGIRLWAENESVDLTHETMTYLKGLFRQHVQDNDGRFIAARIDRCFPAVDCRNTLLFENDHITCRYPNGGSTIGTLRFVWPEKGDYGWVFVDDEDEIKFNDRNPLGKFAATLQSSHKYCSIGEEDCYIMYE